MLSFCLGLNVLTKVQEIIWHHNNKKSGLSKTQYCHRHHRSWWSVNSGDVLLKPRAWFNIKMPSYQYRKFHCGDKTVVTSVVTSSYLHCGISYAGKMTSLYWIRAQVINWTSTVLSSSRTSSIHLNVNECMEDVNDKHTAFVLNWE